MELEPINNGTVIDQFMVPAAIPEVPKLVAQVTLETPTLSEAVPAMVIVGSVVATLVVDGEVIVM